MKKVFVIFTISVLLIFVILLVSCSLGISSMKKEFFTRRGFLNSNDDVGTSEKKYHFAIRSFVQDNEFPDNIGVYALYIVELDRLDESVADWWMKDGVWIPGIAIQGKGESLKPV